jgi:hypothetical protein
MISEGDRNEGSSAEAGRVALAAEVGAGFGPEAQPKLPRTQQTMSRERSKTRRLSVEGSAEHSDRRLA